jgi:hypothetical protein
MSRARLPNRRSAEIKMFEHDGRRYRATFGCFQNGILAEVFLDTGKPDATIQAHVDDSAVLSLTGQLIEIRNPRFWQE